MSSRDSMSNFPAYSASSFQGRLTRRSSKAFSGFDSITSCSSALILTMPKRPYDLPKISFTPWERQVFSRLTRTSWPIRPWTKTSVKSLKKPGSLAISWSGRSLMNFPLTSSLNSWSSLLTHSALDLPRLSLSRRKLSARSQGFTSSPSTIVYDATPPRTRFFIASAPSASAPRRQTLAVSSLLCPSLPQIRICLSYLLLFASSFARPVILAAETKGKRKKEKKKKKKEKEFKF
mmetsp:Transcript_14230/g.40387  ORF Transcript_14230/g.40387 Transcript_14230/m.40387 type:complete len:234 (-) Transcript_14230:861-1562(-)